MLHVGAWTAFTGPAAMAHRSPAPWSLGTSPNADFARLPFPGTRSKPAPLHVVLRLPRCLAEALGHRDPGWVEVVPEIGNRDKPVVVRRNSFFVQIAQSHLEQFAGATDV